MAVRVDPEGIEQRTLLSLAGPAGLHVLEIGCGDGNLSQMLATLRDTMLPKLISGELRVPDAERIISNAI